MKTRHLLVYVGIFYAINKTIFKWHLYLTSLEHPIQLPHKQYSHSFFIAFRGGCCSISQRENQLHGKILLKTLILKNRVRLDKEFGSFSFTIVFFAQILWRLISSTATVFSFWVRFDLCSFAPAERQKIKNECEYCLCGNWIGCSNEVK